MTPTPADPSGALQRSYRAALDAMASAVLIQAPGRGIVYANDAAARMFGVPDGEGVADSTPEEIAAAWTTTDADGRPLTADRYPSRRILSGEVLYPEPLFTRGVHTETGREAWLLVTARPVLADDGTLELTVSVSEDITAIKRAELFQTLLAGAAEILARPVDDEQTLAALAQLVVPDLADWCSITMPADDGALHEVALAHRDPDKVAAGLDYHRRYRRRITDATGAAAILRGEPPVLTEITDAMLDEMVPEAERRAALRRIGIRSLIQVPIRAPGGTPLGVLNLVDAESRRSFTREDLELALELGRRAGIAIENARLLEQQSQTASVLQRALMPAELPSIPGFQARAAYRPADPANTVGGDFYDAFHVPGGWALIVGDIAGKGVRAAALTAQARHVLRSNTMFTGDIVQAVTHLNQVLCAEPELSMCSVCAVLLPDAPYTAPARLVCAGHPRPVLVRGDATQDVGAWGPLVGAFPDSRFAATEHVLQPGDLLVMYTDGLVDTKGEHGRLGPERLHAALAGAGTPDEAIGAALAAARRFELGPQADDTALVAVRRSDDAGTA